MKIYFAGPLFTSAEREWNAVLRDRLVAVGGVPWTGTSEEFAAFVANDVPVWEEDARRSGLKTD